jgi:hypothetical protein
MATPLIMRLVDNVYDRIAFQLLEPRRKVELQPCQSSVWLSNDTYTSSLSAESKGRLKIKMMIFSKNHTNVKSLLQNFIHSKLAAANFRAIIHISYGVNICNVS